MRKTSENAKLIIQVEGRKGEDKITTVSVYDTRDDAYWDEGRVKERGIESFLNMEDLKETLNWNLNGDSGKYSFKWGMTAGGRSEGLAHIFD